MGRIGRGPLDVALLPFWGWGPFVPVWGWLPSAATPSHLDPRRATEGLRLLRPLLAVPIYWATYAPPGLGRVTRWAFDPPRAFRRHAAELTPEVEVRARAQGASLWLDETFGGPA